MTSSGGEGQRQKQGNKQESKGEAEVGVELSTVQPGRDQETLFLECYFILFFNIKKWSRAAKLNVVR